MTQPSPIGPDFPSPTQPGMGKRVAKLEALACTSLRATQANAALSQSPVLTSTASTGTKTTLGEIQQTGCGHLGLEGGDAQMERDPVSLFSSGNQALKLSLCPGSPPDLFPSPHPPEHQPTPLYLHQKKH